MMLFTFLVFILFLIAVCLALKNKAIFPVAFCGAFAAALVCAFRTFFLFAHRVVPFSFSENFAFLLIRQSLLPLILLYGLFFLISRDSAEFKIEMSLPLTSAFYMVYLPYCIISSAEGLYSAFALFVKPLMYIAMLYQVWFSIKETKRWLGEKKIVYAALYALAALVYLLVPAMVEAMYMINTRFIFTLLCAVPYCLLPLVFYFFKEVKMKSNNVVNAIA